MYCNNCKNKGILWNEVTGVEDCLHCNCKDGHPIPKHEQLKTWADRFNPQVIQILAPYVIRKGTPHEDRKQCTDWKSLPLDIGQRIRKNYALQLWPNQFTMRGKVNSGKDTELHKILRGWGDLYFYGFSNKEETELEYAWVGDLNYFRKRFKEIQQETQGPPGKYIGNKDGSGFFVYEKKDFPGFEIKPYGTKDKIK